MAASITASRFALLKVEGGSDDEKESKKSQSKSKDSRSKSAQKKKGKKKQSSNDADLRSMAFAGGKPAGGHQPSTHKPSGPAQQDQFSSWVEHDKDHVDELFQDELQQAILLSKVETEKQEALEAEFAKVSATVREDQLSEQTAEGGKRKGKGRNKNKPKVMSVEEFCHGSVQAEPKEEHEIDKRKVASGDDFFNEVAADAANIMRKDKLQEEYKKQYKVQAVLQARYKGELEGKDEKIDELTKELTDSQEELKSVKKRNKQLCFILGQGEMKEKAEILQQVDVLTQVKDELMTQVSTLTGELEKEKSKVHSLQNELTKLKNRGK